MVRVELRTLQDFADRALLACLDLPGRKGEVLSTLSDVSVVLISDRRMSELHKRFLAEAGPTDVITFQHGEMVLSVETARRQARAFRTSFEHELCLYIAHGLLHLRGFDDKTSAGAAEMKRVQEKLVAQVRRAIDATG